MIIFVITSSCVLTGSIYAVIIILYFKQNVPANESTVTTLTSESESC